MFPMLIAGCVSGLMGAVDLLALNGGLFADRFQLLYSSDYTLKSQTPKAVAMVKSICTKPHSQHFIHEPDGSPIEPQ